MRLYKSENFYDISCLSFCYTICSSSIIKIDNIISTDITNKNDLKCLSENYDLVIHLAAKINVAESILNPSLTKLVKVDGTKNILELCKEYEIKNFIAISSAAVYGEAIHI